MTYALYDTETEAYLKRFNVYGDALLYMAENQDEILTFESQEGAAEHLALLKAFHKKHNKSWMVDTFFIKEIR